VTERNRAESALRWTLHPARHFPDHEETWRALNSRSVNSPALDPAYFGPMIELLGSGDEILGVCSGADGVKAMVVLVRGKFGAWESFMAAGCPFGAWLRAPDVPLGVALGSLARALPGFPLLMSVSRQDPDLVPRPDDGGRIRTLDYITTARVSKQGTFPEFLKSRSKGFRQNLRTARNRLTKAGVTPRLELITDPDAMAEVVREYGLIESAGWKLRDGNNIHPDNAQGRFFMSMMTRLARQGEARAYRYWYGEKLVAVNLYINRDGVFYLLRTTYDETEKATSPGSLLHHDVFESLFDLPDFRAIEFYGEYFSWEAKWTNESRVSYHVNYYRWPALACAHELARGKHWRQEQNREKQDA